MVNVYCRSRASLKGYARIEGGKNKLPMQGAPPRIVLFVVRSHNERPDNRTYSVTSGWALVTAHLWAKDDGDGAWDLRTRFFQALPAQAAGTLTDANGAGVYWKLPDGENERWDIQPDTSQQGQEFEIDFLIRTDAPLPAVGVGEVDSTSAIKTATLTADLGAGDVTATVDATSGYPSTGVLHIDGEQMSYSGLTATSFTGLVRGINGTTAAAHSSGAEVDISVT